MNKIKAAGYTRVSTEEQAREGYGLDAQKSAVEAYCKAQGWQLVEVYIEAGVSGKSTRGRGALARMLQAADAHAFDRLVFWKLDRLSRNLRDVLDLSDRLENAGVEIVSVQEGIDAGTATGRLQRNILGTLAEFERETITERIKEALAEKARQGELLGPIPLGYRRLEDGRIAIEEEEAAFIRALFTRYAVGDVSLRELATWARGRGARSTNGKPFDRLNLRKLLANISYTGKTAYKRRSGGTLVVDGAHPAIVDDALFDRVQQARGRRRRKGALNPRPFGKTPYPLSNVAKCAACGAPMSGSAGGRAGTRYMRCSTSARGGRRACSQRMVPAELLERQLAAYVSTMELGDSVADDVVRHLRAGEAREPDAARALRSEIQRWHRLFVIEDIDEDELRRRVDPLKRQLELVEQPDEKIDHRQARSLLREIGPLFLESDMNVQRKFVREVFEELIVDGEQLAALRPRDGYQGLFEADRQIRFGGQTGVVIWLPGQDSNLQPCG